MVDADADSVAAEDAECARVRHALLQAIDAEVVPAPGSAEAEAEFKPYRQHCVAAQRAMQAATGLLRGRLRDLLARQSPAKARLAELDAVMEATLSPRELMLLARVPQLLGLHYRRLREAGAAHNAGADAPDDTSAIPAAGPILPPALRRAVRGLARISYALFLVHFAVILLAAALLDALGAGGAAAGAAAALAAWAASLLLAVALHRWVEAPWQRLRRAPLSSAR